MLLMHTKEEDGLGASGTWLGRQLVGCSLGMRLGGEEGRGATSCAVLR